MLTQLHEKESAIRRLEEDKERVSHENLQLRTRLELVADLHDQTKEEMGGQIKAATDALEYERAEHASEWHAYTCNHGAASPPSASVTASLCLALPVPLMRRRVGSDRGRVTPAGTQRQYAHAGDELSRTLHEHGVAIRERDFYRNQYDLAKQMRKDVRDIIRSLSSPFWFALGSSQ